MKYRLCKKILAIVLLMSFWKIPVFGEPPTTQTQNSEESGMKQYSESEVDTLIEDLTGAAHEAIEGGGGSCTGRRSGLAKPGDGGYGGSPTITRGKQPLKTKQDKDSDCNRGDLFLWGPRCWGRRYSDITLKIRFHADF
jgi:hypothetical protein